MMAAYQANREKTIMIIRQEKPGDIDAVHEVVRQAFEKASHTSHDEHNLVNRLRKSEAFIPELSLVAEENGQVVGHILFTRVKVGDTVQLGLAPLAVLPQWQGKGIGGKLIETGHALAKKLGYGYSILVGHERYYPRFGYFPASRIGVTAPFDVPDENLMAFSLQGKDTPLDGMLEYPAEFLL